MRILTHAVRQAMALAAAGQPQLIPCSAPPPAKRNDLPESMQKYWAQRKRLFSRFDEGIKMDRESWYSVTPEAIAQQIAARAKCKLLVDGFCGAGGNTIQFALTCDQVIAIDIDPNKIRLARANAAVYGVAHKIRFVCADFRHWIDALEPAVAAAIDYLERPADAPADEPHFFSLAALHPEHGHALFHRVRSITDRIVFFLPRHTDLRDLAALVPAGPSGAKTIEVEENWLGAKCKALSVYFGPLVASAPAPA
ncbi:hypothetical protein PtB15_6B636 [Puccinia triticina]|nr:hypothetical protein PtB15_6B636 [Puccinia triticina]